MRKFWGLLVNEYSKLFHQLSTWLMVAMTVLAAVGWIALGWFVEKESWDYRFERTKESIESDLAYAKETQYEGWELDVKRYEFQLEHSIFSIDWRYQALDRLGILWDGSMLRDAGMTQTEVDSWTKTVEQAITQGDYQSYNRFVVDYTKLMNVYQQLSPEKAELELWFAEYVEQNQLMPDYGYEVSITGERTLYALASECLSAKQTLLELETQSGTNSAELKQAQEDVLISEYRLEHEILFNVADNEDWRDTGVFNFWTMFGSSVAMVKLIGFLMIVVAGSIVASEFSNGTVKFLLLNPVKRGKILMSKYATALSFGFLLMAVAYVLSLISAACFAGTELFDAVYLHVSNGTVQELSGFVHVLCNYLLDSVNVIVMATLAFAISSLVRNSALAIGIGLFSMLSGSVVSLMLSEFSQDWGRYLVFSNLNLLDIANGQGSYFGQTLGFSIFVLVTHMIVFLLTAWDGFVRREI